MHIDFYKEDNHDQALQIFIELGEYYLGEERSSDEIIAENLRANILGSDSGVKLILVFDKDGVAIGMATISLLYPAPKESCQLFIKELFVSKSHQNKGVGKSILGFIARYAQSKQCSRIDLTVDSDNIDAIEFYKKVGISSLNSKIYLRAENGIINDLAKYM